MTDPERIPTLFREWIRMFDQLQAPVRQYQEQLLSAYAPMKAYTDQLTEVFEPWREYWEGFLGQVSDSGSQMLDSPTRYQRDLLDMAEPLRSQMEQLQERLRDSERLREELEATLAPVRAQMEQFQSSLTAEFDRQMQRFQSGLRDSERFQSELREAVRPLQGQMQEFSTTLERAFEQQMAAFRKALEDLAGPIREQLERFTSQVSEAAGAAVTSASEQPPAAAESGDTSTAAETSSSGPGDGQALEEMTREQLYQLAQERDIKGRAGMSKEELLAALQQQ